MDNDFKNKAMEKFFETCLLCLQVIHLLHKRMPLFSESHCLIKTHSIVPFLVMADFSQIVRNKAISQYL